MKALIAKQYGSIDDLELTDIPKPRVGPGDVLVNVYAGALNAADQKVITGADGGRFLHAKNFPFPICYDYSGVVETVGEAVADFKAGDVVFGFLPYSTANKQGTLAEFVSVPADTLALLPEGVSFSQAAAAATTASTALQGWRDKGRLRDGQRVFVNGASGGVGSYAVPMARLLGASDVWGTCSFENVDYVRKLGADQVLDYKEMDLSSISETFDVFFDAASRLSFSKVKHLLSPAGVYITLLPSPSLMLDVVKTMFSSKASRFVIVKSKTDDLKQIGVWLAAGAFDVAIRDSFTLETAKDALKLFKAGGIPGKIVIKMRPGFD